MDIEKQPILHTIPKNKIRYSQFSISPLFNDKKSDVKTFKPVEPYIKPIEVMAIPNTDEYLSMDNRRLYSIRNHAPNVDNMSCAIPEAISTIWRDVCLDKLIIFWRDAKVVNRMHKLTLCAKTVEAVFIIRCVSQHSDFPLYGQLHPPPDIGRVLELSKSLSQTMFKLHPFKVQGSPLSSDQFKGNLNKDTRIYVQPTSHNLLHQRDDICDLFLERNDLFNIETYEVHDGIQLKARGESQEDPDLWDDWDSLFAAVCEAREAMDDYYDDEQSFEKEDVK